MSDTETRNDKAIANEDASEYELAHMISPQKLKVKDENLIARRIIWYNIVNIVIATSKSFQYLQIHIFVLNGHWIDIQLFLIRRSNRRILFIKDIMTIITLFRLYVIYLLII